MSRILEFYDAAVFGDEVLVVQMLEEHPDLVNQSDEDGFTALHGVASEDYLSIAELLLERGADANAANQEGITPLYLAALPEMVSLLVRYGADVNFQNRDGMTPLFVLASEQGGLKPMERLLQLGADPNIRTNQGLTPLDIALARGEAEKIVLLKATPTT